MHLRVVGNGLPVQIELSGGEANDAPMAELLLNDLPAGAHVLADKGYDADWIRELVEDQDCTPHIPPRRHRYDGITYSKKRYKQRNLIERCFNKLMQHDPPHRDAVRPQSLELPRHDQARLDKAMAEAL